MVGRAGVGGTRGAGKDVGRWVWSSKGALDTRWPLLGGPCSGSPAQPPAPVGPCSSLPHATRKPCCCHLRACASVVPSAWHALPLSLHEWCDVDGARQTYPLPLSSHISVQCLEEVVMSWKDLPIFDSWLCSFFL